MQIGYYSQIDAQAIAEKIAGTIDKSDFELNTNACDCEYYEWNRDFFEQTLKVPVNDIESEVSFYVGYEYRYIPAKFQGDYMSPPDPDKLEVEGVYIRDLEVVPLNDDFSLELTDEERDKICDIAEKELKNNLICCFK
ncbi:MAG: hypothetical protein FWD66_00930 [Paludibacter sp.]|nr:hypothetical protein [Paludibacter sp.]